MGLSEPPELELELQDIAASNPAWVLCKNRLYS